MNFKKTFALSMLLAILAESYIFSMQQGASTVSRLLPLSAQQMRGSMATSRSHVAPEQLRATVSRDLLDQMRDGAPLASAQRPWTDQKLQRLYEDVDATVFTPVAEIPKSAEIKKDPFWRSAYSAGMFRKTPVRLMSLDSKSPTTDQMYVRWNDRTVKPIYPHQFPMQHYGRGGGQDFSIPSTYKNDYVADQLKDGFTEADILKRDGEDVVYQKNIVDEDGFRLVKRGVYRPRTNKVEAFILELENNSDAVAYGKKALRNKFIYKETIDSLRHAAKNMKTDFATSVSMSDRRKAVINELYRYLGGINPSSFLRYNPRLYVTDLSLLNAILRSFDITNAYSDINYDNLKAAIENPIYTLYGFGEPRTSFGKIDFNLEKLEDIRKILIEAQPDEAAQTNEVFKKFYDTLAPGFGDVPAERFISEVYKNPENWHVSKED